MKINVKTKVGSTEYQFLIDEQDEMLGLNKAIALGNPPQYCQLCKNKEHFKMDSNKDKEGNTYVSVMCRKCGAKAKLGQYKSKGYFWHSDFEIYVKPGSEQNSGSSNKPPANDYQPEPPKEDNDGLPF